MHVEVYMLDSCFKNTKVVFGALMFSSKIVEMVEYFILTMLDVVDVGYDIASVVVSLLPHDVHIHMNVVDLNHKRIHGSWHKHMVSAVGRRDSSCLLHFHASRGVRRQVIFQILQSLIDG